jgi:hypothetical protein
MSEAIGMELKKGPITWRAGFQIGNLFERYSGKASVAPNEPMPYSR